MGLTTVTQGEGWGRTLAVGQGCSGAGLQHSPVLCDDLLLLVVQQRCYE